jgi:hypothetical protein
VTYTALDLLKYCYYNVFYAVGIGAAYVGSPDTISHLHQQF